MKNLAFYRCKHCGNIAYLPTSSGVPVFCCGEAMEELKPNTADASAEKHVPFVTVEGSQVAVQVGSVLHPALAEHHIEWICLETETTVQFKQLAPTEPPKAEFASAEKAVAVYAFCNIHGLWVNKM